MIQEISHWVTKSLRARAKSKLPFLDNGKRGIRFLLRMFLGSAVCAKGGVVMAKKHTNMDPVVHFELPAEDRKRMAEFYANVFGWKTEMLGPEMGDYVLARTTESDEETGRPKNPGAINGGFFTKSTDKPDQHPSVVIAVEDIKEHMEEVEKAGGTILGEPMDIPGVGSYVAFIDTEGNRVSMLQPSREFRAEG